MKKIGLGLLLLLFTPAWGGQPVNLYDAAGNAITSTAGALNINGSITATNPSVGTNATTAPTSSTQVGFLSGANLVPVSAGNPLPITGTISASNPSVSTTGSAVPASATYLGASNGTNLIGLLLGQQTMANSLACVLPSNQSAIPVTESGTWNITNISGTITLPTGAATSALQTSGNTTLTTITGQLPATLGAKTTANSMAVNIASDQIVTTTDAADGSSTGGTAGTKSALAGGIFNTVLPTLTTGQQAGLQLDASGRQIMGTSAATIGVVNQGTANTAANAWFTKTTDGTNTGAVKAASTAAVAADPAQVVALSPNNNTLANALITKLSDGTNTAAVKAASTAAVATDPAVVVALSPNNGVTLSPAVTGSGSAAAATVSTVATLTAPANCTGFILQNLDTSTANIRWSVGRTSSTTLGQQLQPGRDTGFVPIGANISIIAESGTQNYDVQWIAK